MREILRKQKMRLVCMQCSAESQKIHVQKSHFKSGEREGERERKKNHLKRHYYSAEQKEQIEYR